MCAREGIIQTLLPPVRLSCEGYVQILTEKNLSKCCLKTEGKKKKRAEIPVVNFLWKTTICLVQVFSPIITPPTLQSPIPCVKLNTSWFRVKRSAATLDARGCAEICVYCDHANSISFQIQDEGVRSEITERGIFLMKFSACQQKIMLILWRFHYISFTYLTAANGAGFRNYIIMYLVSNMIFLVSIEEFRTELNFFFFFVNIWHFFVLSINGSSLYLGWYDIDVWKITK